MISRYIVNPVKELTNSVQRIGQSQDLSERIAIHSQNEIGVLSTEFNNMLNRVNNLMTAMVNEQTAKCSAQLQSLYAQINPHFIYNAITSIRILITSGVNSRADRRFTLLPCFCEIPFRTMKTSAASSKNGTFWINISVLWAFWDAS